MPQNRNHLPLSFFPYLLMRVLPVAALVMTIVGIAGLLVTQNIAEKNADKLLAEQSKHTSKIIQYQIDNISAQVENLSVNALIVNGLIDMEGRAGYLPAFFRNLRLAGYPQAKIEMADYRGRILFKNKNNNDVYVPPGQLREQVIENGWTWSRLTSGGLALVYPVRYDNNTEGAVIVTLGENGLNRLFDVGTQYSETIIVDADRRTVTSSNDEFATAGSIFPPARNDKWRLISAPLEGFPGVEILTMQWNDVALASQRWLQNFLIVGILIALAVLGGAIAFTAFIATRDVALLSKIARKIGETKDLGQRVIPSGPAELFVLSEDFNKMLETLQRTTSSFEYVDSIISNSVEGIITINSAGLIETINPAATRIFGYSEEETIGQNMSLLIPQDGSAALDKLLNNTASGTTTANQQQTLFGLHKNSTPIPLETNVTPMRVGGEYKFIGVFRNITERQKAENALKESEERYRQLSELSSDWVWEMDKDFRFSYFSPGLEKITGRAPSSLLGKTRQEISVGNFSSDRWLAHLADLTAHREFKNFRYRLIGLDGEEHHVSINGYPAFDKNGNFAGYRGSASDVTSLHTAKVALELAKDEAIKANQAKSDFLSSMSHELRTPMNAILGFGQMLEFNPKEPLTPAQKDCVDMILKGGQHLLDLINDILDLAQIEAGKIDLSIENVDLDAVVEASQSLITDIAKRRGIKMTITGNGDRQISVRADFTRLKQVLLNLMSNAIKYNNDGGSVTINIKEQVGGLVRISVTDTGNGIAESRQGDVFQAFQRLGAENSDIEGSGIGLLVCKDMIELMNGQIGFESTPNQGSTFWIQLPRGERLVTESLVPRSPADSQHVTKIRGTMLYVEDNPSNLRLMEMIVSRIDGLQMFSTHTAELGIDVARSKLPDLILMDINLPGMSGIDAMRLLRDIKETAHIPVLALSAAATKDDIEKGLTAGFTDYLTKPVSIKDVTDAIDRILNEKRYSTSLQRQA